MRMGFDVAHGAKVTSDGGDAERLSVDPVLRAIAGKEAPNKQTASVITMGRFETELLTQRENLAGLSEINGKWVQ